MQISLDKIISKKNHLVTVGLIGILWIFIVIKAYDLLIITFAFTIFWTLFGKKIQSQTIEKQIKIMKGIIQKLTKKIDKMKTYKPTELGKKYKVKPATTGKNNNLVLFFKPLFKYDVVKKTEHNLENQLKKKILQAGKIENPYTSTKADISYTILCAVFAIPISIILAITIDIIFLATSLFSLSWWIMSKIKIELSIAERKTALDYELPIFITYV